MKNLPKLRKALYAFGVALAGILMVYGIINEREAAAWLLVFAALLGVAFYNVDDPDSDTKEEGRYRDYGNAPLHDDELGR